MTQARLKLNPDFKGERRPDRLNWSAFALSLGACAFSFALSFASVSKPNKPKPAEEPSFIREDTPGATTPSYSPNFAFSLSSRVESKAPPGAFGSYKETLRILNRNYYGSPFQTGKTRKLTYEAIRGMISSLNDQFSSFLDPDDWNQMLATTEGDFEGIGALLEQDGERLRVVKPIEGSPAETAGILTGDYILSVDGVAITGQGLNEAVRKIKGREGTKVRIVILRGSQKLDFNLVRTLVEPPVVKFWMEDDENKIGHIVLMEFNEKSVPQLQKAAERLESLGMKALVFDLRYNPGGLVETSVDVASLFIPKDSNSALKNVVVYTAESANREKAMHLREPEFALRRVPILLLVNGGTASAAEIVSGAMKDYGVATLMGERTYGKGRVQTLYPLEDGSALRLTTSLYYPPKRYDLNFERYEDGTKHEGTGGILPDIEVKQSSNWRPEDFKDKLNDLQLQTALRFLRSRLSGKSVAQASDEVKTQN